MGQAGRLIVAGLGAIAGALIPGIGWAYGFAAGSLLGALLFPKKRDYGPEQIANLQLQTTAKGTPLQLLYGKQRVAGNVIWHGGFKQVRTGGGKGGKGGGGGKGQQQQDAVTYTVNVAIALTEGQPPIDRIHRIWSNKDLVDLTQFASQIAVYKGTSLQAVDATINSFQQGVGASQPVVQESTVINGTSPTYRLRFPPVVATSEEVYSYGPSVIGGLGSRTVFTRVASAPTQNQYTIDNLTGLVTFGGSYTNVTIFITYKFDGTAVTDAVAYRNIAYVVFKDWPLGSQTTLPNFTFEVSRRHQVIEGDSIGVWTSASTMERRNLETGALIETLTISPGNPMIANAWQWMAASVSGSLQVQDAETGALIFNGGIEQLGIQVYSSRPAGLITGDGIGVMGGTQKLKVHSWEYNSDYTFKKVTLDWVSPDAAFVFPNSGGGLIAADLDEFYVYVVAVADHVGGGGSRALHVYNRKAGLDKKGERIKVWIVNRTEVGAGPSGEIDGFSIKDIKVEGSLLYVYWSDATIGEVRVYDMAGRSNTSSTRGGGLLFDYGAVKLSGGVANLGAAEWPLVQTISVHRNQGTFGRYFAVCGPVIICNNGATSVRAYRIADGVELWSATSTSNAPVVYQTKGAKSTPSTGDNNAAWVAYDMLTHTRYGASLAKTQMDLVAFKDVSIELARHGLFVSPAWRNRGSILQHLENFFMLVDCFIVYSEGKFKAKARRQETGTLPQITTATYHGRSGVTANRQGSADIVNRVVCHYVDRANDYTPSSEEAKEDWSVGRQEGHEMEVGGEAITNPRHARMLAYRTLWTHSFKRITARIPYGPQDNIIEPGDVHEWTDADLGFTKKKVRVTNIGEEQSGRAVMDLVEENDRVLDWYDYPSAEFGFLVLPQPVGPSAHTKLELFEPTPIVVNGNPSIFGIVSGHDRNWAGARLYASNDNATYTRIGEVRAPTLWGVVRTSLPATASQFEDNVNTFDVELLSPDTSLVSVTDAQWRAGVNKILVGKEVIYFRTATLVSGQRYTLSGLQRGMELTDSAAHAVNEGFMVLNQYAVVITPIRGTVPRFGMQQVRFMPIDWALIGRSVFIKATSISLQGIEQPLSEVQPVTIIYKATGGMPGRVNNLRVEQRIKFLVPASDNFNRPDSGPLGGIWTEDENSEAFQVNANQLFAQSGVQWGIATQSVDLGPDQFAELKFKARTNNPLNGPAVRLSGTRTSMSGYAAIINPFNNIIELRKFVNEGVQNGGTNLGTAAGGVPAVDDLIRIEAVGSSIVVKKNGAAIIGPVTDIAVTTGKPGLVSQDRGFAGSAQWDDWSSDAVGAFLKKDKMGTADTLVTVRPSPNRNVTLVWEYTDPVIHEDAELENAGVPSKWSGFSHYRVLVKDGAIVRRAVDNLATEEFTYTEGMNVGDAGAFDTTLTFEVYAVSREGGMSEVQILSPTLNTLPSE